jgi:hypothetical protein
MSRLSPRHLPLMAASAILIGLFADLTRNQRILWELTPSGKAG